MHLSIYLFLSFIISYLLLLSADEDIKWRRQGTYLKVTELGIESIFSWHLSQSLFVLLVCFRNTQVAGLPVSADGALNGTPGAWQWETCGDSVIKPLLRYSVEFKRIHAHTHTHIPSIPEFSHMYWKSWGRFTCYEEDPPYLGTPQHFCIWISKMTSVLSFFPSVTMNLFFLLAETNLLCSKFRPLPPS